MTTENKSLEAVNQRMAARKTSSAGKAKTIFAISRLLMGLIIAGVGLYIVLAPVDKNMLPVPQNYIFGGASMLYGLFRAARELWNLKQQKQDA